MIKHTLILNNIPVDIRWLEVDDLSTIEDDYMYYWGFEVPSRKITDTIGDLKSETR